MKSLPVEFAKNSYQTRGVQNSTQRLLNLYPEINPQDNKAPISLYGTPGFDLRYDLGIDNPIYGMQQMGSNLFVICGNDVYKIGTDGVQTNIGSIGGAPGRVMLANNGTQLFILDQTGQGYIATTTTLTKITDPDYQLASSVTYLDGYFVLSKINSDQFFISKLLDGLAYDALDFATAEWEADELTRTFNFNGQIVQFGTKTTEFYQNTGAGFPLQRINGASIEQGSLSKFSITKKDNNLLFLGEDRIVYKLQGYQFVRVSTYPIEKEFESYNRVSIKNCIAFIYTQDGHSFYVLSFPEEGKTWCYDIDNGLWHERGSIDINYKLKEWNANAFEFFNSDNLVGDSNSGKIYKLNLDTYTENGTTIISEAIAPVLFNNTKRTVINRFRLDLEAGQGTTTGQGFIPQIMMQFSKNGGFSYSSELWRDTGKIGEYKTRVVWRKLGIAREIVFKIRITDPVKKAIYQAFVDIEEGEN